MNTPFGVQWEELAESHLHDFFAVSRQETQLWEGKGGTITPRLIREQVCGFANSTLGGYLVLGVDGDKRSGEWKVTGWEPPGEADQWISDSLRGNLDPLPPAHVKSWAMDIGRALSVIRVWPVAVPPCVTVDGGVLERVGPSTSQVKDAASLHRLFDRGAAAERRAWDASRNGRDDLAANPTGRVHQIVVSLGAPALPSDVSDLAFRKSVADVARHELERFPLRPPLANVRMTGVDQHSLTVSTEDGFASREGYTIRIRRMGSVAVGLADPDIDSGLDWVVARPDRFTDMWRIAATVAAALGGVGPAHAAIQLADEKRGLVQIDRWTTIEESNETIEAITREVRRIRGEFEWEPE